MADKSGEPAGAGVLAAIRGRAATAAVLGLFAVLFIFLAVSSYTGKSATWDEPVNLAAGYVALKLGDYRIDTEHPPLLRLWAALPLLFTGGIKLDTDSIYWTSALPWGGRNFLYTDNDADRLLYRARFMIAILGVGLGFILFAWARELFGFEAATGVLLLYALEPNILAHACLVTTDFGLAFFFFGTVYFLWRLSRSLTPGNLAGLAVFFGLAQASKFSAILLWPLAVVLLLLRALGGEAWIVRQGRGVVRSRRGRILAAAGVLLLATAAAYLAVWASYGFRFDPSGTGRFRGEFSQDSGTSLAPQSLAGLANLSDEGRVLPRAYTQGFLLGRRKAIFRDSFLFGAYSGTGWWYYFPAAFLVKTPLALLILFLLGTGLVFLRRSESKGDPVFLVLPPAAFLATAMASHLNIGLRHILPVYPFVLLLAGRGISALLAGRRKLLLVPLALLSLAEFASIYPDYLAFFNLAAGGPAGGHKYLVDSNLDWGQDLKGLKRWMDGNNVDRINLSYFGSADPAYYRINCVKLPGTLDEKGEPPLEPSLPGYVAVSATYLRGIYLPEGSRGLYAPLLGRRPAAVIGRSIYVYRLEGPWW